MSAGLVTTTPGTGAGGKRPRPTPATTGANQANKQRRRSDAVSVSHAEPDVGTLLFGGTVSFHLADSEAKATRATIEEAVLNWNGGKQDLTKLERTSLYTALVSYMRSEAVSPMMSDKQIEAYTVFDAILLIVEVLSGTDEFLWLHACVTKGSSLRSYHSVDRFFALGMEVYMREVRPAFMPCEGICSSEVLIDGKTINTHPFFVNTSMSFKHSSSFLLL
jgi:hypothetical protein